MEITFLASERKILHLANSGRIKYNIIYYTVRIPIVQIDIEEVTMDRFFAQVEIWRQNNTLLRVIFTKKKVGRKSFSGRIMHLSQDRSQILFYNDDTKSVFSLEVNEIDDIINFK